MSSSDIAIRVDDVSKRYEIYASPRDRLKQFVMPRLRRILRREPRDYFNEFWALRHVSFEVRKGETVGIVGRNGSGKSTLLQIICGTLSPTTGNIHTEGRIAALLELGSGFNPEFTGRENVYLNGTILGLSQKEIEDRYDDIAAFADIGDFINRPVKTYSSGMQVRLAFAVQAMVDPRILIVDEALAVGDERFQRKCFARLQKLKDDGTSILFVSHAAAQVEELCDRALLLEQGQRLLLSRPLVATRAYQRLIYAPKDEQPELIQQYQASDRAGNALNLDSLKHPAAPVEKAAIGAVTDDPGSIALSTSSASAVLDPALVPETTRYPIQGAEIHSIKLIDGSGLPVNVLNAGETYQFVVSGRFQSALRGVLFGIHIRSVSGLVVTGQRSPEDGRYIDEGQANQSFEVTFNFRMILLPGTYFVGAGVWAEQGTHCAHRILDSLMFRVLPDKSAVSFGYVDASEKAPSVKFH